MKYHYKSPEELKRSTGEEREAPLKWRLHSGHKILLFDLVIIVILSGIFYYNNLFIKDRSASDNTCRYESLEFSSSVSSSSKKKEFGVTFQLHVKNISVSPISFPDKTGRYKLKSITTEFTDKGALIFTSEATITEATISSGETKDFQFEVLFSEEGKKAHPFLVPAIRLNLENGVCILSFPGISL